MSQEKEINDLIKKHREEVEAQKKLIDLMDYIPTVRFINMLRFFAKMLGLSDDALFALIRLIQCNTEGLEKLKNKDLKEITEFFEKWAEAELEAAGLDPTFDSDTKDELKKWQEKVKQALDNWDPNMDSKQAAAVVSGLKVALLTQFPKALNKFKELIPDDIAKKLGKEQLKKMGPSILRKLLEAILKRWLIKKFGKEVGKSLSGWIKVVLDLIELGVVVTLLYKINDLAELIDEKLVLIIKKLAKYGLAWPNNYTFVWVANKKPYKGAIVTMIPYMRCAKRVKGKIVWCDGCKIKFADGTDKKAFRLGEKSEYYDPEKKIWRLYYDIDKKSTEDCKCLKECEVCYTYLLVIVLSPDGMPMVFKILIGVKVC